MIRMMDAVSTVLQMLVNTVGRPSGFSGEFRKHPRESASAHCHRLLEAERVVTENVASRMKELSDLAQDHEFLAAFQRSDNLGLCEENMRLRQENLRLRQEKEWAFELISSLIMTMKKLTHALVIKLA